MSTPTRKEVISHCQRQGHTPKAQDVDAALATPDPLASILPIVLKRKGLAADAPPEIAGAEQEGPEEGGESPETPEIDPMNQQKTLPPEAKDTPQKTTSAAPPSSAAAELLDTIAALCSGPAPSFAIRRVQAQLSGPDSAGARDLFARLSRGLRRGDHRLASGRKVDSTHAAAVWLLQQLAAVIEIRNT